MTNTINTNLLEALDIYKSIKTFWEYIDQNGDETFEGFWSLSDEMGSNIRFRTFVDLNNADRTLAQCLRRFAAKNDIPQCEYQPDKLPTERICKWEEIEGSSSAYFHFDFEIPDADAEIDLFPDIEEDLYEVCE